LGKDCLDVIQNIAFVGTGREKYPLFAILAGAFYDVANIKIEFVSFYHVRSKS